MSRMLVAALALVVCGAWALEGEALARHRGSHKGAHKRLIHKKKHHKRHRRHHGHHRLPPPTTTSSSQPVTTSTSTSTTRFVTTSTSSSSSSTTTSTSSSAPMPTTTTQPVLINAAPELRVNQPVSVVRGNQVVLSTTQLFATDVESISAAIVYTLVSPPAYGDLHLNGTVLLIGGFFTQADIDAGRVTYVSDASATDALGDAFSFTVADGDGAQALEASDVAPAQSVIFLLAPEVPPPAPSLPIRDGLLLWLDASDVANLAVNANQVVGAQDLSGHSNQMILSAIPAGKVAVDPVWDGAAISGRGAIRFNNGRALVPLDSAPFDSATLSIFVVARPAAWDTWDFIIGKDSYAWGSGYGLEANFGNLGGFANGGPAQRQAVAVGTVQVLSVVLDLQAIRVWADGNLQTTDTTVGGLSSTPYQYRIGAPDNPDLSWGFNGWVGEALHFDHALSDSERQAVENYLQDKWKPIVP